MYFCHEIHIIRNAFYAFSVYHVTLIGLLPADKKTNFNCFFLGKRLARNSNLKRRDGWPGTLILNKGVDG